MRFWFLLFFIVYCDNSKCLYQKLNTESWQKICPTQKILSVCEGPSLFLKKTSLSEIEKSCPENNFRLKFIECIQLMRKIRFFSVMIQVLEPPRPSLRYWIFQIHGFMDHWCLSQPINPYMSDKNSKIQHWKVPNGIKCFTITTNEYVHSPGYFKIQIGYSDFSHFIDHSKIMFDVGHFYTICYNSLPLTLKLIVYDGTIAGNGGDAFLLDIEGSEIRGVKCDELLPTKPGCIVGHPNADVNEEAYKIGSF